MIEGEASDVDSCTFIGDFRLVGLPENLPKGSPVELHYAYDDRGHIHVMLKELSSQTAAQVEIAWSHGMDDNTIDALANLARAYRIE